MDALTAACGGFLVAWICRKLLEPRRRLPYSSAAGGVMKGRISITRRITRLLCFHLLLGVALAASALGHYLAAGVMVAEAILVVMD